jgi:transcriptional regulator with XRE-family HTH domain
MHEHVTTFGDLLRRLRSAAALSQEALAERAGLSRSGISDLERGARQVPRLETVRTLADALALSDAAGRPYSPPPGRRCSASTRQNLRPARSSRCRCR